LFQKNDEKASMLQTCYMYSTLHTLMIMSTTQNCLNFVFSEKNQADGVLLIAP